MNRIVLLGYPTIPRILLATRGCYLDDFDEDAAGNRALMGTLARCGSSIEVLCGMALGSGREVDPARWLAERGGGLEANGGEFVAIAAPGLAGDLPPHHRLTVRGVPVTIHRGASAEPREPEEAERAEFVRLFDAIAARARPDILLTLGDGQLIRDILARARGQGIATAFLARGVNHRDPALFEAVDAVIVPTRFAATYYREALGLRCAALPLPVDYERARAERTGPGYVTFIDPTPEHGVHAFARVADELGRRRPDIPLLVVEGRGTEATLADCGLNLRARGNVNLMAPPADPRKYWGETRVLLMPALGWDGQETIAAEALVNGVPVVASDRGGLPETLGGAGVTLPLPDRLTPATRLLPTAEEAVVWIEAVIRLWDDRAFAEEHRRKALLEARRWDPEVLGPRYVQYFADLAARRESPDRPRVSLGARAERIQALAAAFPWPERKPTVEAPITNPGWLDEGTDRVLARELSAETQLVVELGAWLGMSSRYIADHAPNATVISVDHWLGSPEHQTQDQFRAMLPTLHETFLAQCWDYRDRIIPLRISSLDGLQTVAEHGLEPDLIYIDAEHSYAAVASELELARHLFPRAVLVGDDYDWEGVARAANEFAGRRGLVVERVGHRGWKIIEQRGGGALAAGPTPGRTRSVVLVPHLNGIDWECEQGLRQLEQAGIRVVRRGGSSAIDMARNVLFSDALHDGFESMMFIDADIGFDPLDVMRLLARPEPVVCGVYAKKGERALATHFADGVAEVLFGPDAPGLYPARFAATGFLCVKATALRKMIQELKLPLCNTKWGRGVWPFFLPLIIPHDGDKLHYLGEDWAFSHRLAQIGITPLADTSVRLWHWGRRGYGWEDAGADATRYRSYNYRLGDS